MEKIIGKPVDRKDGHLKVTGGALYAAEHFPTNMAYAVMVTSTISKGHIRSIDDTATRAHKGVVEVITYKNSIHLHQPTTEDSAGGYFAEKELLPLQTERIFYNGQHVALVIANTFQAAEHGAALLKITYDSEKPLTEIEDDLANKYQPKKGIGGNEVQIHKGDAEKALRDAAVKNDQTYVTPVYHHNAMEPHAATALWEGDQLTIYDTTQAVFSTRAIVAKMMGTQPEKVRILSPFVGGGFGSKGFMWPHAVLAAMASKQVGRPVKLVINRMQMFSTCGRRSRTIQNIVLGAGSNGKLAAVKHDTTSETSFVDEFVEPAGVATKMLYDAPNFDITQNLVRINKGTPCPTRAPGEAVGMFAYEVAIDELAEKLNMDPLELRLANYAEKHPQDGKEWSLKNLKDCYQKGADAIGWKSRNAKPRSMQEDGMLVGYGMATASYPANRQDSTVKVRLYADGKAAAASATQDIGTGTYTVMAQILAENIGVAIENAEFKLGDSSMPKGANSGGSQTSASVGPALRAGALLAKSKAIQLAIADKKSPLYGQQESAVQVENGRMFLSSDTSKGETYAALLKRQKMDVLEAEGKTNVSTRETKTSEANPVSSQQSGGQQGGSGGQQSGSGGEGNKPEENPFAKADEAQDRKNVAFHSFGAHFVKVMVDPFTGFVRVSKVVSVIDAGTILNEKTARSQIIGGVIWGLGQALTEATAYDPNNGRPVTKDLADYHVPSHADMPEFDIQFIGKPDLKISPVGSRGIGEIGTTGITAAIINAVHHATGKWIRELPATPDKVMG